MKSRILAGIAVAVILSGALLMGQIAVTVLAIAACMIAVYEFASVIFGYATKRRKAETAALIALAVINLMLAAYWPQLVAVGLVYSAILIFIHNIVQHRLEPNDIVYQIFSLLYVALPLGLVIQMYSLTSGSLLIWLIFVISTSTDSTAYFVGMKYGKRRLAPAISPKKSVEGAIGGFVGSVVFSILFGVVLSTGFQLHLPLWQYALVGMVGSVFGQFGDLSASLIKRKFNKKDYGNLIPGHGGILDRIDSILFIIPVVYLYAYLVS